MTSENCDNETSKTTKKDQTGKSLGKVIIDTGPQSSGSCPFHTGCYVILGVLAVMYIAFIVDEERFNHYSEKFPPVRAAQVFFQTIEKYSPFMDVFESDEELYAKLKKDNGNLNEPHVPKSKKKKKKGR